MPCQHFALFDYVNAYAHYGEPDSIFDEYGGFGGFLGWFLLNLLITFFVYCIPLIGYIHITAKELTLKSARKLCLIYSAIVFVVLSAVYALLEQNISANAGAAVIWGYYVNMAIIKRVYLKPRTRPITQRPSSVVSSSTATNEAEHWKKQYFDLYTQTQQSSLSDSILDGLSEQEIDQVHQYVDFLKKSRKNSSSPINTPRTNPATPPHRTTTPEESKLKQAMSSQLSNIENDRIREKERRSNDLYNLKIAFVGITVIVFLVLLILLASNVG